MRLLYLATTTLAQETLEGATSTGSSTVSWKNSLHQQVIAVERDGAAHLVQTIRALEVPIEAEAMGLTTQEQVAYFLVDTQGRLLVKSDPGLPGICRLPAGEVSSGDSWEASHELLLPYLKQPLRYQAIYVLGGLEELEAVSAARVDFVASRQTSSLPLVEARGVAELAIMSSGSFWMLPRSGRVLRVHARTLLQTQVQERIFNTLTMVSQQLESITLG